MPNQKVGDNQSSLAQREKASSQELKLCYQNFRNGSFSASGSEGMRLQTEIIKYHIKMKTFQVLGAYLISALFASCATFIVLMAPDARSTAANLFAGAFLVMAMGASGFARFVAKGFGIELKGDSKDS